MDGISSLGFSPNSQHLVVVAVGALEVPDLPRCVPPSRVDDRVQLVLVHGRVRGLEVGECAFGLRDVAEDLETLVRVIALADNDFQDVVVDLEGVKWLNSTGLGWLVGLARQRKHQGDAVALVGTNERIANLLEVTSLTLALPSHATLAEAVASLRAQGPGTEG